VGGVVQVGRAEEVQMPSSAARDAAHRYVELVNAQEFSKIGSLFAADAVVLAPTGEEVRGLDEITALWAEQYSKSGPAGVSIASELYDDTHCAVELSPRLPGEAEPRVGYVIDHFSVDAAGAICRLAIFTRPKLD
jgi:hypothetical protein